MRPERKWRHVYVLRCDIRLRLASLLHHRYRPEIVLHHVPWVVIYISDYCRAITLYTNLLVWRDLCGRKKLDKWLRVFIASFVIALGSFKVLFLWAVGLATSKKQINLIILEFSWASEALGIVNSGRLARNVHRRLGDERRQVARFTSRMYRTPNRPDSSGHFSFALSHSLSHSDSLPLLHFILYHPRCISCWFT